MAEARLSVRVDTDIKQQAEEIFRQLGLTLSAGINTFLSRVVAQKGIPFPLTLERIDQMDAATSQLEQNIQQAVLKSIAVTNTLGAPVALFDQNTKRPFLRYPDGHIEFEG